MPMRILTVTGTVPAGGHRGATMARNRRGGRAGRPRRPGG